MSPFIFLVLLMSFDNIPEKCHGNPIHDQVLSIKPITSEQVDILRNITSSNETVLWQPASPSYITEKTEVHLYVPVSSVKTVTDQLRENGVTYSVVLEDTQELIEDQKKNNSANPRMKGMFFESYHSLEDIYHWINKTSQEYSHMATLILIGSSYEKRPLYMLKLSVQNGVSKNAVWMDCGIHAREWISPAFCLWFVNYAITFYNVNSDITAMLNNMDFYILPVMNPDGYKYTWTTNRMWRKNRSRSKDSDCVGADLNRNFDANWCTQGASKRPCDETYCGAYPESEPEAQAVAQFLRSHRDTVKMYFSIHSYSQMLLFPYSCTYDRAENHDELLALVKKAAERIRIYYRNVYKFGSGAETIYLAPGGSDDWAYKLGIPYSFTFELQDRGRYGFLLPAKLISKACSEALLALKTIVLGVLEKIQL
ncbi:carboxypeptidase B2 [Chanos chanos]|uniref:Carboxypeptidase B2 n=1 Tax=Chanos chanos TaxID=29144 RepID=A0A6J2VRL7_CHACN|nr:carboxypeptidase B2 [Chanos chanos]